MDNDIFTAYLKKYTNFQICMDSWTPQADIFLLKGRQGRQKHAVIFHAVISFVCVQYVFFQAAKENVEHLH